MNINITELEKDVLVNGIGGSDFYDYECADIWSDILHDTCKVTAKDQLSGVVASLVKKGLVTVSDKSQDSAVKFTSAGLKVYKNLNGGE